MFKIEKDKKQYFLYCFLLLILLIPNFVTAFYASDLQDSFVLKLSYLLFSISIWLLPLAIIKPKIYFSICSIFLLIAPLEISFVKSVGQPISDGFIESLIYTNYREATEQLPGHLIEIVTCIFIIIIYFLILRKAPNLRIPKRGKLIIVSIFLLANVAIFAKIYKMTFAMKFTPIGALQFALEFTRTKYIKTYPANLFLNTFTAYESISESKEFENKLQHFSFNAKIDEHKKESKQIFILVLGETARQENFGLYGYHRPTTPKLSKEKNLVAFDNVYSAATLTIQSIPQVITRANPDHIDLQYKEKNIIDAFKEAGFYTAWIDNQNMLIPITKRINNIVDFHYNTKTQNVQDMEAIPIIKQVLNNTDNKKALIVIHSMGSHFRYSNRYPDSFDIYKPSISKTGYDNINIKNKEALVNSYDNSIVYTDHFLASIISLLNDEKSAESCMLYLSDHGENLYDDGKKLIFHGSIQPNIHEYHIPYLVWTSDFYNKENPNIVENLSKNKSKKASSTSTFSTFLNMANIRYDNSDSEQINNLASDQYNEPKNRKILTGSGKVIIVD
ncbi:Phosphoethanolamine transferase for glucans (OPG), alkaline phosphatase superfamily [Soonwooa buanensis]|uniref:Phosphoethanolamine transferase for glucans (OPG), alkaline phosphatase superfamily n=1 Tax=Soonwooa buanensis TaxID=619805 RepID=A0A1T5EV43_9FLAO|nr:phosphoethanolamine transferase [Soonwooa buanensis]SKB87761.1 Phosphoethanolamine transferase for glucans (OPG), alkaline phosphatase superfamily [Soonwooa buanensis]